MTVPDDKDKDELTWRIERFHSQRDYLRDFLDAGKSYEQVKPIAQRLYEETDLTIRVLQNWPADVPKPPTDDLKILDVLDQLPGILPSGPAYNKVLASGLMAIGTTGTAHIIDQRLASWDSSSYPETQRFIDQALADRRRIREAYSTPDEVRAELCSKLNDAGTVRLFDNARKAYQDWRGGSPSREIVADAIRSLIENVRGEIWHRVRQPNEQKASYATIAQRCSVGGPGSKEAQSLALNEDIFDELHNALSNVLHRRERQYSQDLEDLWGRSLDHISNVLNLTKLQCFQQSDTVDRRKPGQDDESDR